MTIPEMIFEYLSSYILQYMHTNMEVYRVLRRYIVYTVHIYIYGTDPRIWVPSLQVPVVYVVGILKILDTKGGNVAAWELQRSLTT